MSSRQLDEEAIFHVAREIEDPQVRATYIKQVCAGDIALQERVEGLLTAFENEQSFLKSKESLPPTADHPPVTESEGEQIGRYKLLQKIGEGGFGVVFMAEQKQPIRRRVALKIIKPGMDSKFVVARFEAERQALAMMDHPNIARVLDGGQTNQGRPYFVMDLVKGAPITKFCDDNGLSTRARLELFKSVCQAVQHAHQKGIIHRDLKPSNILVTLNDGQPLPKVIDFGVAKALHAELTEKTYFTEFGQMIGTPQYMSPEQAEMTTMDIDTRSDIYSLGVVLYELLTGSTPISGERLRASGYAEIQRIIREEEPPKPSSRLSTMGQTLIDVANSRKTDPAKLRKGLQGEIDWIVMKALDKERARRYETANGLAMDVDRYLNDEPVEARPPSQWYLISKFASKNRGAVFATSLIATFLMLATVAALVVAVIYSGLAEQRRRDLYISDMQAARQAWDEANIDLLQQLLERNYPDDGEKDLRGFEWYYYWQLCDPARRSTVIKVRDGSDISRSASFSPDGKNLAVATIGGRLLMFDPDAAPSPHSNNPIHEHWQNFVVYGPKGLLATPIEPENEDEFRVSVRDGDKEMILKGHNQPVVAAVFSRDGTLLATSSADEIIVWRMSAEKFVKVLSIPAKTRGAFDFNSDASEILFSDENGLHAYDLESEKELGTTGALPDEVEGRLNTLVVSPDGTTIFAGSEDGFLIAWDAIQRTLITAVQEHGDEIRSLSVSTTNNWIASASRDNTLKIWDAATLKVLHTLKGHSGIVDCVNFSSDGKRLVSTSQDYTVRIWNLNQLAPDPLTPIKEPVQNVIVGDNLLFVRPTIEKEIADIRAFRMADGMLHEVEDYISQPAQAIAVSPNGILAVVNDQQVNLIRAERIISTSQFIGEVDIEYKPLQFSQDGKALALALTNGEVVWWKVSAESKLGSQEVLTACENGASKGSSSRHRLTPHVSALAFSPNQNDLLATGSNEGIINLWNLTSGKRHSIQPNPTQEHVHEIKTLLFHPSGDWLASGGFDNRIRIWSTADGSLLRTLTGHTASIWDLSLSPNGKQLFSSGGDRTIRIWDTTDWQERGVLHGHPHEVTCLEWLDEHTLVSGGDRDALRLWRRSSDEDDERDRANKN